MAVMPGSLGQQEIVLTAWTAPSRPYKTGGQKQMTVPTVLAVLVGVILLMAGEWMLIAVVAALVFAYYVWSTVAPEEAEYKITTRGIRAQGQLYPWESLARWWWDEKWDHKLLMVETPMLLAGRLVMPIGKTNEKDIEKVMNEYLLMERPADTTLDKMSKWMAEKFPLEDKI